jgi:hypothetical protein
MGKTVTSERLNSEQPKSNASELVRFSAQMKITFLSAACDSAATAIYCSISFFAPHHRAFIPRTNWSSPER